MSFPAYINKTNFWNTAVNARNFRPQCHAIIFKNTGDVRATINDQWILEPGEETPTISTGHPEVIDMTEYRINFEVGSAGVSPKVTAIYLQIAPNQANTTGTVTCETF